MFRTNSGANIVIKSTTTGTCYRILMEIMKSPLILRCFLVVSYIGSSTQEIKYADKQPFEWLLQEDALLLEAVVCFVG